MRILLLGFGSRGDVQPLVALGKGLRDAGYEVALAAGINFQTWIEGEGLIYEPINVDVEALVNSNTGKEWLNESSDDQRAEMRHMKRMADDVAGPVADDLMRMAQMADVYVSGLMTIAPLDALAQMYGKRHIHAFLQPFYPTRNGAAGLTAPLPKRNIFINRWWGYLVQAIMWNVMRGPTNTLREGKLGLPPGTRGDFIRAWNRKPALYGYSEHVVPRPDDWPPHLHVTGYWFEAPDETYTPPPALQAFLDAGEAPVYIGFGSMSDRDPAGTLRTFVEALAKAGRRGILHSGWAGLKAVDLPDSIYMLDYAPHEWLFPRMAGIVHHGGAGTTASGLRAGVPSTVIAHMGDQPFWGRRVHELGVGPRPIARHELSVDQLAFAIAQMTTDGAMQARAAALGEAIRAEDGVGNAVRVIGQLVGS
ncbi:MAG: glycosyltransferase family 1 protein [Anaerolineae bacterium]|nr:glycosyltransferase family 1 protein [Anaerolineae bacterium]